MHTIDRPSSLGPSFGKMMVHRILKPLLVFMLLGISPICEAGPTKVNWGEINRGLTGLYRWFIFAKKHPEAIKKILIGFVGLLALIAVVMLIKVVSLWLWKLIKSMFLGLVVYLPRKLWNEKLFIPLLWRKKLYIPELWASRFKLPWLLQVKKFRRPDIWAANIPLALLVFNLILWAADGALCVFSLHYDHRFLFLLAPMLILTYYMYVGVNWARIAIIVLLVLSCPVCRIISQLRVFDLIVMAFVILALIVLMLLPESNAWFREQNGEAETTGSGMIATENHTVDDTSICSNGGEERNAND